MLYSFIPPILIVLSLCGIIIFLMKKSPKIEKFARENAETPDRDRRAEEGFFGKIKQRARNVETEGAKQFMLSVLEKITSKSRVIFLKLESKFSHWSSSIRSKRMKKMEIRRAEKETSGQSEMALKENRVLDKLKEYRLNKSKDNPKEKESAVEERVNKPIISDKIISPRKAEPKDRLEELLVERIAANPKDVEAYERLGEYYIEKGSLEDSKECFKQVIKLDPANRNAKYRMKRLETLLARK